MDNTSVQQLEKKADQVKKKAGTLTKSVQVLEQKVLDLTTERDAITVQVVTGEKKQADADQVQALLREAVEDLAALRKDAKTHQEAHARIIRQIAEAEAARKHAEQEEALAVLNKDVYQLYKALVGANSASFRMLESGNVEVLPDQVRCRLKTIAATIDGWVAHFEGEAQPQIFIRDLREDM